MPDGILDGLRKFFSPKEEVHKHWYSAVDGFHFPIAEFYKSVEEQLTLRKVPGLEIGRVEFAEGGILSQKREYLRLKRERLVFDICAAPFGTSYFFSFRFVELPLGIKPVELIIFLIGLGLTFSVLTKFFGVILGFFAFILLVFGSMYVMRNAIALGLKDLDAQLLKIPVIGPFYELFLRKETYYRQDTRLMYFTVVNSITEALVEEVTAAKGVKLRRFDQKPTLGVLYEERTSPLPPGAALASRTTPVGI